MEETDILKFIDKINSKINQNTKVSKVENNKSTNNIKSSKDKNNNKDNKNNPIKTHRNVNYINETTNKGQKMKPSSHENKDYKKVKNEIKPLNKRKQNINNKDYKKSNK